MTKGWEWKNGKIINRWGWEGTYLHLIDWKRSLETVEIDDPSIAKSFKITWLGIWSRRIPMAFQIRMLWKLNLSTKKHFFKTKLTQFIKYKVLRQNKVKRANVLPQYERLID